MTSRRAADFALIGLLLVVAAIAFAQSYQRWLDPIIDTGRDLYIPEQILTHGVKLYRDIRYQYPPLTPYLLAGITAVLGHSLASYTAIGLLQSLGIALLLWLIGRRVAGPTGGFVAPMFFIALDFCGASTWGANFLFPYSYGATFGMAFLLVALLLFLQERPAAALVPLLAASWCKVEYAAAAALIVAVLALGRRISLRQLAAFAAAGAITFGAAVAVFPQMRDNIFAAALTRGATSERFFRWVAGIADWRLNLLDAVLGILGVAAITALLRRSSPVALAITLVISVALANPAFFRAWGLLQIAALIQGFRERSSPMLTLAIFSIAATLRVPLNVAPVWYGFVLILPLYALIAYVLFAYLPQRGVYTARAALWWIPLIAILCGLELGQQRVRYSEKRFPIESVRGTFYDVNPDRARVLDQFIRSVHGGTLAVMPEGITLNYLTESRTTLSYHTFTPVETAAPSVENAIIDEVRRRPPQRVAFVTRDVREFGYRGFGIDYDRHLVSYLIQHYELVHEWAEPRFNLVLMQSEPIALRNKSNIQKVRKY